MDARVDAPFHAPGQARRAMSERAGSTVAEVAASHALYVSQPAAVARLIDEAATPPPPGRAAAERRRRGAFPLGRCPGNR